MLYLWHDFYNAGFKIRHTFTATRSAPSSTATRSAPNSIATRSAPSSIATRSAPSSITTRSAPSSPGEKKKSGCAHAKLIRRLFSHSHSMRPAICTTIRYLTWRATVWSTGLWQHMRSTRCDSLFTVRGALAINEQETSPSEINCTILNHSWAMLFVNRNYWEVGLSMAPNGSSRLGLPTLLVW